VLVDLISRGRVDRLHLGSRIASQLDVPWICFTTSQKTPSIKAARKLGSHGYISRDLNKDTLRASIKKAIQKQQLEKTPGPNVEWLLNAIKGLSEALFVTDPQGRLVFMNMKAEAISGMSEEECKMLPLDRVINIRQVSGSGIQPELIQEAIAKQKGVTSYGQSYLLSTVEGKDIPGEFTFSCIKDSSSMLVGFLLLVRPDDASEISDPIARAKREWERGMDSVPELVAVLNRSKKIVRLNKAMAHALGSIPKNAVGCSCCPLFQEAGRDRTCLHDETMEDGQVRSEEVVSQKLGGTYLLTVAPYRDSANKIVGTVHIATDISEIRKSQDDLQSSRDSLLKKCEELETALHNQQQQLSEYDHKSRYLSEDLLSHMEAVRMLILTSERKKHEVEQNLIKKLEISVKPLIMQLRVHRLPEISQTIVKALEYHVSQICGQSQPTSLTHPELLTFREHQICDMIRSGLSSKEIAEVLGVSDHTILCHRVRIRKKLGLRTGGPQLAEYLQATKP
jgi:DNA-binding NarL/FixJ family response regulator